MGTLRRTLGTVVAALIVAGCATAAQTTEGAGPLSSVATSSSTSATAASLPGWSSAVSASCDRGASGKAGRPDADSEPLFIIRTSSYWFRYRTHSPVAVVYRDGSVAISPPDEKVVQRPTDPLRPMIGGKFSECGLAALVAEYDSIAGADVGDPQVYDADEVVVTMTGRSVPGVAGSITLEGFGWVPFADLTAQQNEARSRAEAWVADAQDLTAGTALPVDALAVADALTSAGSPPRRTPVAWTAPAPVEWGCTTVTGSAMTSALASVRASFRLDRSYDRWSSEFNSTFRTADGERQLAVMVLPPAMTC